MQTSVIVDDLNESTKYKESLKEFLCPTFENAVIYKDKKIGKNLKIYAQALGINHVQNENNDHKKIINEKKKKQKPNDKKINELEKVIKIMGKQIEKLKEIIAVVCNTIVQDEDFKKMVEFQLEELENTTEKVEDDKDIKIINQ